METVAYHVCCHSILKHSSGPVSFTPIYKRNIPQYDRGMEDGATQFSFSRFLTPFLSGYQGQSIFMDCDMILTTDIYEVLKYVDMHHDIFVVKHDYIPKDKVKFLGKTQHAYPKKNWSSFIVFNNWTDNCKKLTPKAVNESSGAYLHRFNWSEGDKIGEIPVEWNHLVGEYPHNSDAKLVHFTLGTPCFKGYENQEWADEWYKIKAEMNYSD